MPDQLFFGVRVLALAQLRGRRRVEWMFQLAAAALNLRRMQRLLPQPV